MLYAVGKECLDVCVQRFAQRGYEDNGNDDCEQVGVGGSAGVDW